MALDTKETLDMLSRINARLAAIEARLGEQDRHTQLFWSRHLPALEKNIDRLGAHLDAMDIRINALERSNTRLETRLGLFGGVAGIGALAWHLITKLKGG